MTGSQVTDRPAKREAAVGERLNIAYEVQELLFPSEVTNLPSLEVHGSASRRARSAGTTRLIPSGHDRMVLAVGDISGKGNSAALLLATVHAFVRA